MLQAIGAAALFWASWRAARFVVWRARNSSGDSGRSSGHWRRRDLAAFGDDGIEPGHD